jgi:FkbM family methyltransferase
LSDVGVSIIRRLATAPGFRYLTRFQPLLRLSFSLRASLVRERRNFVANELRRRPVTAVYRLRNSGVAVALRHHTGDVLVLDEIFSQGEYEPPAEVEAVLAALPARLRVVDLGANIGLFGAWALGRFPEATILAVEADPGNAAIHRQTIAANGLDGRWRLVEAFAATSAAVVPFAADEHATSHAAHGSEKSIEVTTIDVFPELTEVDLLKIDIEGAEWELLADPRFVELRPRVVVLEYHEQGCPSADPPAAAERALRAAGLDVVRAGHKPQFGAGILWGLARTNAAPDHNTNRVAEDT